MEVRITICNWATSEKHVNESLKPGWKDNNKTYMQIHYLPKSQLLHCIYYITNLCYNDSILPANLPAKGKVV